MSTTSTSAEACVCAELGYCADSPNGEDVCPVCVRLGDVPCPAGVSVRDVEGTLEEIAAGGFVPSDVWRVDPDDKVAYLARPIEHEDSLSVVPRKFVEVRAHDNAEPMILTADEAEEFARVLTAAAAMIRRGYGYAR